MINFGIGTVRSKRVKASGKMKESYIEQAKRYATPIRQHSVLVRAYNAKEGGSVAEWSGRGDLESDNLGSIPALH